MTIRLPGFIGEAKVNEFVKSKNFEKEFFNAWC